MTNMGAIIVTSNRVRLDQYHDGRHGKSLDSGGNSSRFDSSDRAVNSD